MEEPTLPSPPFTYIPGLPNFRDIGGYEIAGQPGRAVKRNLLFRSAEPSRVTEEGIATLRQLGVTRIYDLRSRVEVDRDSRDGSSPISDWDGTRVFAPVFLDDDYSPEALAQRFAHYASEDDQGFVRAYAQILEAASAEDHPFAPFRAVLSQLASADAPPQPLLIHCTAGKDRTGVLCALILSLCGVDDEAVAHEYSLTSLGLRERREELVAIVLRIPELKNDRAAAERLIGSRKKDMLATLAMIRERYGSVEGYVTSRCGLSPSDVEQLRRNLLVDVGSDKAPIDWKSHAEIVQQHG
ncbi:Tyrosine phosphatase [Pleurostoma richardsiae]|uniref:Tyrosine phosphatase n=1 Tax=Pleurostoma richardsiae TaxID=41990 RepID=A0AA38VH24_9PEZI|nr:Tyrosine phosphatase [Pleurostoma richardsiae]